MSDALNKRSHVQDPALGIPGSDQSLVRWALLLKKATHLRRVAMSSPFLHRALPWFRQWDLGYRRLSMGCGSLRC